MVTGSTPRARTLRHAMHERREGGDDDIPNTVHIGIVGREGKLEEVGKKVVRG